MLPPYTPPCLRAHLVGGCILITFMSSDIPARFIALTPADSSDHPSPPSSRLPLPLSFFLLLHVFSFSASKSKPFLFSTKFPSFSFFLLSDIFHLFFFRSRSIFLHSSFLSPLFFLIPQISPTGVLFVWLLFVYLWWYRGKEVERGLMIIISEGERVLRSSNRRLW